MFGSILTMLIVAPVILGLSWFCLRRYNPDVKLWSWRRDRPLRSIVATILFGGASLVLVIGVLDSLRLWLPWYEYLWTAYFIAWLPWLLGLRAAVVDQVDHEPAFAEK